jgi:hypothetical protein
MCHINIGVIPSLLMPMQTFRVSAKQLTRVVMRQLGEHRQDKLSLRRINNHL